VYMRSKSNCRYVCLSIYVADVYLVLAVNIAQASKASERIWEPSTVMSHAQQQANSTRTARSFKLSTSTRLLPTLPRHL